MVTIAAGITAVVVAVLTMRHTFAKELALAISSVFLTIPSLAPETGERDGQRGTWAK